MTGYHLICLEYERSAVCRVAKLQQNEYAYIMKCIRQNSFPFLLQKGADKKMTNKEKEWIENHKETEEIRNKTCK